jgi:hypothetical protein
MSPPPVATKHDERLAAAEETSGVAKQALLACITARDRALDDAAAVADALETERQRQLRLCLERFVNLERQHLAERTKQLNSLALTVANIDSEEDLQRIVDHYRTASSSNSSSSLASESSSRKKMASVDGSSGGVLSEGGVTVEVAKMTQTRGYSRALLLLDWDLKRQKEKTQQEKQHPERSASVNDMQEAVAAGEAEKHSTWVEVCKVSLAASRALGGDDLDNFKKKKSKSKHQLALDRDMAFAAPTVALVRALVSTPSSSPDGGECGGGAEDLVKSEEVVALAAADPSVVAAELVTRCSEPLGRAALLRVLNEGRTGEVLVGSSAGNATSLGGGDGSFSGGSSGSGSAGGSAEHGADDAEGSSSLASDIGESGLSIRFEALCSVFEGALRYCDEQRDVKHAKQFMIMSDSYKGVDFHGLGIAKNNNSNNPSVLNAPTPLSTRRLRTQSSIGTGVVYVQAAVRTHVIWGRRWFWEEVKPS